MIDVKSLRCMTRTGILRLNLKREYFEAIRDGHKLYEYRLVTLYWRRRLQKMAYREIHLCMGYPKRDDATRIMRRKWIGDAVIVQIMHKHFGPNLVDVFRIDVS